MLEVDAVELVALREFLADPNETFFGLELGALRFRVGGLGAVFDGRGGVYAIVLSVGARGVKPRTASLVLFILDHSLKFS